MREREREREQIILVNYQFLALLTEIYSDVIHRSRFTFQIVVDPTRSKKKSVYYTVKFPHLITPR